MNPNDLNQQPTQPTGPQPAAPPDPGTDWQREAVQSVQQGAQPQPTQDQPGVTPVQPQQPQSQPPPQQPGQPAAMSDGPPVASSQPLGSAPDSGPGKKKLILLAIVVLVAALVIAIIVALVSRSGNDSSQNSAEQTAEVIEDISEFSGVSFQDIGNLDGFEREDSASGALTSYVQSTDPQRCAFSFGVVAAEDVPGETRDELIELQVDQQQAAGAIVSGPHSTDALVVGDAEDGTKAYRIPTSTFSMARDELTVATHYSVAILAGNDRVIVNRECVREDGQEIPSSVMNDLDSRAAGLRVTVQE